MNWPIHLLNLFTLSRLPLAAGTLYYLGQTNYPSALLFFLIAVITDWLDGYFARHYHLVTARGENFLEPLSDALLVFIPLLGMVYFGYLSLSLFLFYCLVGLFSQIAKKSYQRYYPKIYFFQMTYLFSGQVYLALWLANQISRGWTITVLIIYLVAAYLKRVRVKSFFADLGK